MATLTPAFLFQIDRIEETPGIRPRLSQHGFWLPPRTLFGSQIKEGHTTRKIFCFDGSTVTNWQAEFPEAAVLYKEISMYHSAGHFFIVPYDATKYQVGNGRQVEGVVDSDDEEDEDAEADEEAVSDPTTIDWSVLSFHWRGEGTLSPLPSCRGSDHLIVKGPPLDPQDDRWGRLSDIFLTSSRAGYTSEAMIDAQWHRLNTQRPNQAWVQELLPDSHHAEHHRHTREPKYGAFNGDLAILIALVAFSGHAGFVERAVKHWQEKRGVHEAPTYLVGRADRAAFLSTYSHININTNLRIVRSLS
ncbi:hypothetical protein EG327_003757 [Venturia inaequalis]|uniref:Uncharacterized protein n=1 Tax=Venturia inaequalis TaxID=5025 RepID=A0A8H3ZCU0_VENIN|nr:hypothetical protein EG327_003757 [Venturia inaequalis]